MRAMGRRRTTVYVPPPEPPKPTIVQAADLTYLLWDRDDSPYHWPYRQIVWAFLEMPVSGRPDAPNNHLVRETPYWFAIDAAMRLIARVRERNLLASILATEALHRLSRIASHLADHQYDFPHKEGKKRLTRAQGDYWIEVEVPEGAALEHGETRLGPGYRCLALVERCHLSGNFYHSPVYSGVVPGFGACGPLLGFDLPCRAFPRHKFEDDKLVGEDIDAGTFTSYGVACDIPFGFVTGSRQRDWEARGESYPHCPKPSLDDLVKLIEEAAKEGQGKPAGPAAADVEALEPGGGAE
jgi:hypothetical protein